MSQDLVTGETTFLTDEDNGRYTIDHIGFDCDFRRQEIMRIGEQDPTSGVVDFAYSREVGRGEWRTRVDTRTIMRATKTEFVVEATLDAYEGTTRLLSRNWQVRHRRDFA